jgi:hypothetical protein
MNLNIKDMELDATLSYKLTNQRFEDAFFCDVSPYSLVEVL